MAKKIEYVTIQVPVGSFICPVGDMERRIKAAQDYMDNCQQLYAEGAVYSESGYYYNDVIKMIEIAAGKEPNDSSPS